MGNLVEYLVWLILMGLIVMASLSIFSSGVVQEEGLDCCMDFIQD